MRNFLGRCKNTKIWHFLAEHKMPERCSDFVFNNKVTLVFLVITVLAFFSANASLDWFFAELFARFGRNTFMVLSLLIPVVAGLGLNFGIVIGAMAAQVAVFVLLLWGGVGFWGLMAAAALATPIAMGLGYTVGRLFNGMKGSEMIGGMIAGLFYDGFYQFFFLWVIGGLIPIANHRFTVGDAGVGVVNTIDLGASPNYFRQAIDDVPMLTILEVAFFAAVAITVLLIIIRLVKKQPLKLGGPLKILIPLAIAFGLSFIQPVKVFLYQPRLLGLYAMRLVAVGFVLFVIYRVVVDKFYDKKPGWKFATRYIPHLFGALAFFAITLPPDFNSGLRSAQISVLAYLLVGALCLAIKWFLNTRLGQNMRTVGHSRPVATAAGINVDRTRIIAMMISTVLAAYAQIIAMQNFGIMNTYGGHTQVGLYAIAALLVGGATVSRASVKHALIGVVLFHALFILAPAAGNQLLGSAQIGEYFRVVVSNAVIALALIMHAWKRVKKRKVEKQEADADSTAVSVAEPV